MFDAHQLGRNQTGNETYARALLREYAARADLDLSTMVEAHAVDDVDVASFLKHTVPRSGLGRLAAMTMAARRVSPDVLHAIYFLPYLAGIPTVLTVHDISYELYPEFFSRTERLRGKTLIRDGARRARFVVTVSETSRRDIVERYGIDEDRVVAIHNGVRRQFLDVPERPIEPIGDRPVRVLALGTLQPRKNLTRLLEAVKAAARTRPIELRVVGPDGYQASIIRDALEGSAAVDIVGYVDDHQLVGQYTWSDMLVYPSIYEGFGLPVVEAMACGRPVVTSTGGSLPEVADDAAIIVDPFDVTAITSAILQVSEDTGLRQELVRRGRVRAGQFSWATCAERHIDLYRRAAAGNG